MDNPGEKLRPGMYGRGAIELERHSGAIVVPVGAVRYSSGRTSVFTVEGDKARLKPVQVGVDGEQWLEITSGLSPTDSVVIAGADVLADGATVKAVAGVEPFLGTKTAPQAGAPATGTGPNPQPVATATAAGQGAGR